jgi:hypothetical protein
MVSFYLGKEDRERMDYFGEYMDAVELSTRR